MADPRDPRRYDAFPIPDRAVAIPPDVYYRPRRSATGGAGSVPYYEGTSYNPAGAPVLAQYMPRPPWLDPPALHFPFDVPQVRFPVAVPVAGSILVALPAIPPGATGTIRRIGLTSSDFANTRTTTRINLTPVAPYAGIVGVISDFQNPQEIPGVILLRSGDVFQILVENLAAVAVSIAVRFSGWWWS